MIIINSRPHTLPFSLYKRTQPFCNTTQSLNTVTVIYRIGLQLSFVFFHITGTSSYFVRPNEIRNECARSVIKFGKCNLKSKSGNIAKNLIHFFSVSECTLGLLLNEAYHSNIFCTELIVIVRPP